MAITFATEQYTEFLRDAEIPVGTLVWDYVDVLVADQCTEFLFGVSAAFVALSGTAQAMEFDDVSGRDIKISIGLNAPDYDDIVPSATLTGVRQTGDTFSFKSEAKSGSVAFGQQPILRIRTSATVATVARLRIVLLGVLG